MRAIEVLSVGPLATVQDPGRPGLAHLGVPRSGWLDPGSATLANRLVGNDPACALLECLFGGLRVRLAAAMAFSATGTRCPVLLDGRPVSFGAAVSARAGQVVELGTPHHGLRTYLAFSGGIEVEPVLGSRATDTLSHLGPSVLAPGQLLPIGAALGQPAEVEGPSSAGSAPWVLRCEPGPRLDWFVADAWERLTSSTYVVTVESNRVGLRLAGPRLDRSVRRELPSEGLVLGAVQVPASGEPLVFLNDHPTTGGYPVIAVVLEPDLAGCAHARPGDEVRFQAVRPGLPRH